MDEPLDLRGLKCPLPALFAKRALLGAPRGAAVAIVTNDPLAAVDVPHMCHRENFEVVSLARDGDVARIVLRKP
jgi:tRNA 2-thiouridine synthesizing protein A